MRILPVAITVCLFRLLACQLPAAAEDLRPTFLMLSDPPVEIPETTKTLPPKIVEFWRAQLESANPDHLLSAVVDIRTAANHGFDSVAAAAPVLQKLLQDEGHSDLLRTQTARTLIALDAREAAAELFAASQTLGTVARQMIEPALAEWDHKPIREAWRKRLSEEATPLRELVLACRGVGRTRDEPSLGTLMGIVHDPLRPRSVRLAAARAAGMIAANGLEEDAEKLLAGTEPPLINRLCAAALLQRHSSEPAQRLLERLFQDPSGPVAGAAISRLFAIDKSLPLKLKDEAWRHPDVQVRRTIAEAYIAQKTNEHFAELTRHLTDRDPGLRGRITAALLDAVKNQEFATAITEGVRKMLHADDWRGQEQACLIFGQIDEEPAAKRFVELLSVERPEVQIAAAWALRKVAVKEMLPAMLRQATRQTQQPRGDDLAVVDRQVAHLFEAFAVMKHRPAIPLLRSQVPKQITHRRLSRGAAVWALGHLLAEDKDESLAAALMSRVQDDGGMPPEIEIVRRMSAISLGRMKAASQLNALKKKLTPETRHDPAAYSMQWAIRQISGESIPFAPTPSLMLRNWRIQPPTRPSD